jgi:eukaryotic-like serine/threonine-protein kinase
MEYSAEPHLCAGAEDLGDFAPQETSLYDAGAVIGKYRLVSLIGEGAIGRVYLAEHLELGRRVALKLLRSKYGTRVSVVERFFGEARAVNQIHHENIVEITDFVREDELGRSYYIMELLEGRTLYQLMQELKTIPLPRMVGIARQICSALEAVHARGIVHRDLKPENIFLTQKNGEDFVKLLDFGAAKISDDKVKHHTVTGTLIGTPAYMSPEQTFGGELDHRADIYGVGVLLFEMATGRALFEASSTTDIILAQRNETPVPPKTLKPDLPDALDALIRKALAKDPDARQQSMAELRAEIMGATPPPEKKRSFASAFAVVGALVLFAGAIAAFALPSQETPPAVASVPRPRPSLTLPIEPPDQVTVVFRSKPDGATVLVNRAAVGRTPHKAQFPRSEESIAYELRLDGYTSLADVVRPTDDSTVSAVLAKIPAQPKRKPVKKKKKRGKPTAPRVKTEIGLGDMK